MAPLSYLAPEWQERVEELGVVRDPWAGGERVRLTEFQARGDAITPDGGPPGSDPHFAAEQHLDTYEISAALLDGLGAFGSTGLKHQPTGFSAVYCRALNEHRRDTWLAADPRWYSSISLSYELPDLAVQEIEHCKTAMGDYNDRFRALRTRQLPPPGHPSYWPIYEACQHYDLPVAFHILTGLARWVVQLLLRAPRLLRHYSTSRPPSRRRPTTPCAGRSSSRPRCSSGSCSIPWLAPTRAASGIRSTSRAPGSSHRRPGPGGLPAR